VKRIASFVALPATFTNAAFLRNPNYHRAGDTADTLDYARMAREVRSAYAVAMEL
jgi:hypothetical protein